jgi:putative inorganic carbon (hco3(-)) transporter
VKRLFGALFLMTIPAIFFTYSRGALVGFVAVMLLLLLQLKQRAILAPVLLLAMGIGVVLAPQAWKDRMNPTGPRALDLSARSRFNAWRFSWNLASDYPITGGGFRTFSQELFDRYAPNSVDVHGPHSIYFGILAEHGFVGLFLFLALIASCIATTLTIANRARLYGDEVALNYALMFQLSLAGFLTSGLFLGRQYFDYFYTVIACITALKKICLERWSSTGESDELDAEESPDSLLHEAEAL